MGNDSNADMTECPPSGGAHSGSDSLLWLPPGMGTIFLRVYGMEFFEELEIKETHKDPQLLYEAYLDPGCQLWALVTENVFKDLSVAKCMNEKGFCLLKLVNDDLDGSISMGLEKVSEEIYGDM